MKKPFVIECEQIFVQKITKGVNGNEKIVDYSDEEYCEDIKHLAGEFVNKYEKQDSNLVGLLELLLDHFVLAFKDRERLCQMKRKTINDREPE